MLRLKLDKISHESPNACDERKKIDEKIDIIERFVKKYKDDYYEISRIKGFRGNQDGKIAGRDYYYYIADQKMKASVYYVRYLNFFGTYGKEARRDREKNFICLRQDGE